MWWGAEVAHTYVKKGVKYQGAMAYALHKKCRRRPLETFLPFA